MSQRGNGKPRLRAGLFGIGIALPERELSNDDLAAHLDTSDAWIVRRTGIRTRRRLADGESLASLAATACENALRDAGRRSEDVDHLLVSTITPDRLTPGLAPDVAHRLGLGCAAADLNGACAGFLHALGHGAALVESRRADTVLVCGAEALSRITDHDDRGTAVLFGDGAGAVVVCAGDLDLGLGPVLMGSDGAHPGLLYADTDGGKLRMEGREVYRHAVARMVESTRAALAAAGRSVDDLDLFVAHQANARIIESAAAELGLDARKVVVNIDRVANTSSASIPLALWQAEQEGRLVPGATIGLAAFGAGFVWGAAVASWKERVNVCC